jgi:uncharacterized membrane protein
MDLNQYIIEFLKTYFFSGYNIFNTVVYGMLLILIIFGLIKLFKKLDKNPAQLILYIIPFIFIGSSVRAFVDNRILPYSWFLITPCIYFIVGGLTILSLMVGIYLERKLKIDYKKTLLLIGLILLLILIAPIFMHVKKINIISTLDIIAIWIILTSLFFLIGKFSYLYKNKYNLAIISAHIFDATTTFIAVDLYGYSEQHVLPNLIYKETLTSASIYPLKIIVITVALYTIEKYIEDEKIKEILKLAMFILGFAPGMRNILSLAIRGA